MKVQGKICVEAQVCKSLPISVLLLGTEIPGLFTLLTMVRSEADHGMVVTHSKLKKQQLELARDKQEGEGTCQLQKSAWRVAVIQMEVQVCYMQGHQCWSSCQVLTRPLSFRPILLYYRTIRTSNNVCTCPTVKLATKVLN